MRAVATYDLHVLLDHLRYRHASLHLSQRLSPNEKHSARIYAPERAIVRSVAEYLLEHPVHLAAKCQQRIHFIVATYQKLAAKRM
jgi:hypothetical protein